MTKTGSKIKLPPVSVPSAKKAITLPFNGSAVSEKSFSFSFSCFDHSHELFNLGDSCADGVICGNWFIDLLDCLKNVNTMTVQEVKTSTYDLHPVDWDNANAKKPQGADQQEYWQFRINKSKGRVIGILIDGVFYIVWLDPHHNLTDSEGYGKATYYNRGLSIYEQQEQRIQSLIDDNQRLQEELKAAEELLTEQST